MKKVLALVLAFAMVFSTITVAFADTEVSAEAKALATLGMLEGDGNGVTVEYTAKELTRLGAAAALLKLKGLYDEAIAFQGEDNFADVKDYAWVEGRNLMAYLKANPGLGFGGDEKGNFNPGAMINEQSYYKVLLETLGYKQTTAEVAGDFAWEEVFEFAEKVGLKPAKAEKFTIDELAKATFAALTAKTKDGKVYVDTLIAAGVVTEELAVAAGVKEEAPVLEAALKSAVALGNTVVEVTFDAAVNEGAEDVSLYTINGLDVEEAIITGEKTVRLTTSAQEAGKKYTLTVGDVKVNFGGKAKVSGAPALESVTGPDTERVELVFNKTLDFVTATDKANYEIKDVEIVDIELDGDTVTLITNGLTANKTHTVKVTGVKSVDGIALKSASKNFYAKSDKTAPKPETRAESLTYTRVLVKFNEELDKESAENVENYVIDGLTVESALLVKDDTPDAVKRWVELTTSPQKAGASYTIKINGIKDASVLGNEMTREASVKFTGKAEDKTGPTVPTNPTVLNRNRVLITFADNSRLNFETLENAANYEFDKDVVVESAELIPGYDADTKQVILTVSDMAEKTLYKLTISGVTDEYGNEMKEVTKSINYVNADLGSAKIKNVVATSATELKVTFDKHVDPVTAKDVANYSINGDIGTPISAKINSGLTTVTLKVNKLVEGKSYKLTINGVEDLAGNVLNTNSTFIARTLENDIDAPEIVDITVLNKKVLRLEFSESINVEDYSSTMAVNMTKANGTSPETLTLGAVYDDNTVLEFTAPSNFEFQDIEYKLVSLTDVYDNAGNKAVLDINNLNFWGNTLSVENIDFSWEQVSVVEYKLTFSEKVKPKTSNSMGVTTSDADDIDDFGMDTVWYFYSTAKEGKVAWTGDINNVFENYHGATINNTDDNNDGKTTITASMVDEDGPYIEDVKAIYRDEIRVIWNEDLKDGALGTYKLSWYDAAGKLKEVSLPSPSRYSTTKNELTINLGSSIRLESRFDYTLKVVNRARDLAGNYSQADEEYSFMGTDLARPENYITGVTFTNGSVFDVNYYSAIDSSNSVTVRVYSLDDDGNLDDLIASDTVAAGGKVAEFSLTNNALLAGTSYKVVTVGHTTLTYTFDGIVAEGIDVEVVGGKYRISYSGIADGDKLVVDGGTPVPVTTASVGYQELTLGSAPDVIIVFRDDVPLYYYVKAE